MQISPVSFMAEQKTSKSDTSGNDFQKELKDNGIKVPKVTPLQSGAINAVGWFGFGFLLDRLLGKLFKSMKTPLKLSLVINGGIGLIAGSMAYIKEKKNSLEKNI